MHKGINELCNQASDYLAFHPDDGRDPEMDRFGSLAWENKNSKAPMALYAIHLLTLPIYYICLRVSYFCLIPSLLTYGTYISPPYRRISLIENYRYWAGYFWETNNEEPSAEQMMTILTTTNPYHQMIFAMQMARGQI